MSELNPLPPPSSQQRGKCLIFGRRAAVLTAIDRSMEGAMFLLKLCVIVGSGLAGGIYAFWASLTLDSPYFPPLSLIYWILLFEGGGLILAGIGSLRWPAHRWNGRRVPRSRYAGEICLGIVCCFPWTSQHLGVPAPADLLSWFIGLSIVGISLLAWSLVQGRYWVR